MKYKIFLSVLIVLVLAFFVYRYSVSNQPADTYYFSFTTIYDRGREEPEASVSEYNLQNHQISEVYRFPVTAMYALGVYDKTTNFVFYSKEHKRDIWERPNAGDQIHLHDLTTGSDRALTEDLFAVNYILPVNQAVFFLAATLENTGSLVLGKVDLRNGNVQYWDEANTASSRLLSIDREKERLYVAIFDVREDDAFFRTNSGVVPTHTICSYDYNLGDKREIVREENMNIRSIYVRNNIMMYTVQDALTPASSSYTCTKVIDLDSMEVLLETDEIFTQEGCLSVDETGAYSFSTIGDFNGISYYDFSTGKYTPVLREEQGDIANFQLMPATK